MTGCSRSRKVIRQQRGRARILRLLALAVGLSLALACGGGREVAAPVQGPGITTSLAVKVVAAASDSSLARALGWVEGVPGATVKLLRFGTSKWISAETDGAGEVTLDRMVPGRYRLYATRELTPAEATASTDGVVRAFGDGTTLEVRGSTATSATLSLLADRAGGLVIAEVSGWGPPLAETGGSSYNEASYFEIYNNSTRTEFLDGKIFGITLHAVETIGAQCARSRTARRDPGGVLATQMIAFPGSGGEHPIGPGEIKLVALAAIDHTPVSSLLFDLSGADFEIGGAGSANNPAVVDMIDIGLERFVLSLGGISVTFLTPSRVGYFLAEPFDPRAFPVVFRDDSGRGWIRVPGDRLIDVAASSIVWPDAERDKPPCSPIVSRAFDQYEGGFTLVGDSDVPRESFQRRILRVEGGQPILQDTRTSAADFVEADLSPGTLPPPE